MYRLCTCTYYLCVRKNLCPDPIHDIGLVLLFLLCPPKKWRQMRFMFGHAQSGRKSTLTFDPKTIPSLVQSISPLNATRVIKLPIQTMHYTSRRIHVANIWIPTFPLECGQFRPNVTVNKPCMEFYGYGK